MTSFTCTCAVNGQIISFSRGKAGMICADLLMQPGARVGPITLGGRNRDAERLGGFFEREADKIAKLDDFSLAGVMSGEPIERFVHRQGLFLVAMRRGDFKFVNIDMLRPSAALVAMLSARALDENSPHRLGGRGEEMRSVGKNSIAEAKPGLMHQRSRLKSLSWPFPRHLLRGELAQFPVNQQQQCVRGYGIAKLD